MNEILEKVYTLVNSTLYHKSPVLSGNMRTGIRIMKVEDDEVVTRIDAPYYDLEVWQKTKVILLTGETENGKTDYAEDVNLYGGFKSFNKSRGWVDRAVRDACEAVASQYDNVEVIDLRS